MTGCCYSASQPGLRKSMILSSHYCCFPGHRCLNVHVTRIHLCICSSYSPSHWTSWLQSSRVPKETLWLVLGCFCATCRRPRYHSSALCTRFAAFPTLPCSSLPTWRHGLFFEVYYSVNASLASAAVLAQQELSEGDLLHCLRSETPRCVYCPLLICSHSLRMPGGSSARLVSQGEGQLEPSHKTF